MPNRKKRISLTDKIVNTVRGWFKDDDDEVPSYVKDRVRRNTTPTANKSMSIENRRYNVARNSQGYSDYDISFDPKQAVIIAGNTTSYNVLDSLAKYAGIHNRTLKRSEKPIKAKGSTRPVSKYEAIGLSTRETKNGAQYFISEPKTRADLEDDGASKEEIRQHIRAMYNANGFTAFKSIPANALVNNYHYNQTSKSIPPLLDAFRYYAQGDYNRGDSGHTRDVKDAGREAFDNQEVRAWWEREGKYWFETGKGPKSKSKSKKKYGGYTLEHTRGL